MPKYAKDLSSDMPSLKIINVLRYKKKINRPGSKEIILPCLGAEFVRQTPKIIKFIIIIGTARAHSNWALSESSSILNTLSKDSSSESFSFWVYFYFSCHQ